MFDDHAADDSPVKKVRSEFVIVNLTIVTNLMMHDFDGHYLHVDFYLRRNMVTERLRMELIIGPDVFVGELHDVCKEFAEGRQVHSNLQSHDGGGLPCEEGSGEICDCGVDRCGILEGD